MFKLGVIVDSFRLPVREGLRAARRLGADGVQMYAVAGEMAPENLDAAARGELKEFIAGLGLEISALCGDLGGHGFTRADGNPAKIARSKEIVRLARDLGTRVVTTHIGVVPDDPAVPVYDVLRRALSELAGFAAGHGVTFAVETGPESARTLRRLVDDVDSPGLGVNLDPANLAMVLRADPIDAVKTLAGKIVHTHAKDGINLKPCTGEQVYGAFADGTFDQLTGQCGGELFREVPLGEGSVPWPAYLKALASTGYRGYLTVERETGDQPAVDIERALVFLRERIAEL